MNAFPSNDPLLQQLQLLLTGYGYNFYSSANQARSDDLLVRERASYHLARASDLLTQLRLAYQQRYIPPLTCSNPDPPAEALTKTREIEEVQQQIANLETAIRGMATPAGDRIWWRFRQEVPLLRQLLAFDLNLVRQSEALYHYVSQLTPELWNSLGTTELLQLLRQLANTATERERLLLLPL